VRFTPVHLRGLSFVTNPFTQLIVSAFAGGLFIMAAQALPHVAETRDLWTCQQQQRLPAIAVERQLHCAKLLSETGE
jgi:hypothetical protein